MPQILLLNHAAHVNKKRMDKRIELKRETKSPMTLDEHVSDMPHYKGKRLDELTSEEYMQYQASA